MGKYNHNVQKPTDNPLRVLLDITKTDNSNNCSIYALSETNGNHGFSSLTTSSTKHAKLT